MNEWMAVSTATYGFCVQQTISFTADSHLFHLIKCIYYNTTYNIHGLMHCQRRPADRPRPQNNMQIFRRTDELTNVLNHHFSAKWGTTRNRVVVVQWNVIHFYCTIASFSGQTRSGVRTITCSNLHCFGRARDTYRMVPNEELKYYSQMFV